MKLKILSIITMIIFSQTLIKASYATELELLMFDEIGCFWCEQWNKEVGTVYPKTPEGELAPLHQLSIKEPLPEKYTLKQPLVYTPTFILIKDGQEQSRIEGYPGDNLFWGMLGIMLKDDLPQ